MLAHRFLSSLNTTCSSRATFQLSRPISRANFTTSGTQLKLGTKASNAPYSRSSILTSARRFSTSEAKTGPKYGLSGLLSASAVVGAGLSLASLTAQRDVVECEAPRSSVPPPPQAGVNSRAALPPPPQSSINVYELSFGTVCGICAGVFIKKGVKAVAFVLGGVFILLQYFTSLRLTRVDWTAAEGHFQKAFYSSEKDAAGNEVQRAPTVYKLWQWVVNFLTADFPPRATFIAGMILGLRLG